MNNQENRKIRILFAGDNISSFSGLAHQTAKIMLYFLMKKDEYEVAFATLCGSDVDTNNLKIHDEIYENIKDEIKIYNCQAIKEGSAEKWNNTIKEFNPDFVISNVDPWYLDSVALSPYKEKYFWIAYTTIETNKYPDFVMFPTNSLPYPRKSMKDLLNKADLVVPVTSVGEATLKNDMKLNNVYDNFIYNGVDFSYICKDDNISKIDIFGNIVSEDDFIFMTLGTNSERKKIDVIIEAFAKFIEKMNWNKKYKLYIHTDLDERIGGTDLMTQVNDLKLLPYVFAPSSFREKKVMIKEDLYKRYKACDCYIGLPAGEGFGLGYIESMIHKKPIIYHDYGGSSCFLNDVGLPVKTKTTFAARNVYIKWGLADIDDAAKQMCRVVSDEKLRKSLGEKSFEKSKEFDWNVILPKFEKLIKENTSIINKNKLYKLGLKRIV